MGLTTGIEWTHATWNPHYGCHKVSAGCKNCYMFRDVKRYGKDPNFVIRAKHATFIAPLTWARNNKLVAGSRIFTCSWSDWFIEEADKFRNEEWDIIRNTPMFDYLILTKRPERIADHLPLDWGNGYPNVWLGVSTENQEMYDKRVQYLANIPAVVKFISAEPLLGDINLHASIIDIDWVITGGESDPENPRKSNIYWFINIRDQCTAHGIPYFHKQNGGRRKIDGSWGGRLLDGRTWDELPR